MDPLEPLITALHAQGRLRVWSLVITVFGDLVQHRGGEISSGRLRDLLGRVGVEPGAMRTALSRLVHDGWVTSKRQGRASHYRLSAQGLNRFAPATSQIYAPPTQTPVDQWAMVVRSAGTSAQRIELRPAGEAIGDADCVVTGSLDHLSDAFRDSLMGEEERAAYAALAADLSALEDRPNAPLDAAAARMLLIHRWRRIVLRYPETPEALWPGSAPLAHPRAAVAGAYQALSPAAERWLGSETETMPALPPADPSFATRFGGIAP